MNNHMTQWDEFAAIEGRNWRDIADMAIAKARDAPGWSGDAGDSKWCYTGQIYLVNRARGTIAKTIQPTVVVRIDGMVVTEYQGGGCRGRA